MFLSMNKSGNIQFYAHQDPNTSGSRHNCTLIEEFSAPAGSKWQRIVTENKIIFTVSGKLAFTYKGTVHEIGEKMMFIMPRNSDYKLRVVEDANLITFCITMGVHTGDILADATMQKNYDFDNDAFFILPVNDIILEFLHITKLTLAGGAEIGNYYEFKYRELLIIMMKHYETDDLVRLFNPVLKSDAEFIGFVLENYEKVKTAKELAELSHYSMSAFKKRFKENFGQPPYVWMKEQKCIRIFNDISSSNDSLKEISDRYDFSSMSQMTTFCKTNFGKTPSQIRRSANTTDNERNKKKTQ